MTEKTIKKENVDLSDIRFYSARIPPYGFLSNFYNAQITLDGKKWPTTEHYFQAMKFSGEDEAVVEKIRLSDTSTKAAALGRNRKFPLRRDWDDDFILQGKITRVKLEIMKKCLYAKFTQHLDLKRKLIATKGRNLVERTANDRYWGDGGDGRGKNMLGRLLVEVRDELIREDETEIVPVPESEKKKEDDHPAPPGPRMALPSVDVKCDQVCVVEDDDLVIVDFDLCE